ncbi:GSCOCG00004417001-RA-CDS [Cotesia congregata]|nr:GSCOCG00004417001-RA-CDS [Cotesia congregata]
MSAVELNPRPVRVSPLIKFSRWTLLTAGIMYGLFYQNRFSKKEAAFQEVEMKRKAIRDKQLAEEKKRLAEAEIRELEKIMK